MCFTANSEIKLNYKTSRWEVVSLTLNIVKYQDNNSSPDWYRKGFPLMETLSNDNYTSALCQY